MNAGGINVNYYYNFRDADRNIELAISADKTIHVSKPPHLMKMRKK
jgi:hypothetical protein